MPSGTRYDLNVHFPDPDTPSTFAISLEPGTKANFVLDAMKKQMLEDGEVPGCEEKLKGTVMLKPGDLAINPLQTLNNRVLEWLRNRRDDRSDEFRKWNTVKSAFPNGIHPAEDEKIDIVLVNEDIMESLDSVSGVHFKRNRKIMKERAFAQERARRAPSPSEVIKSAGDMKSAVGDANGVIHYGRPVDNFGPPTVLFDRSLATLKYLLDHPEETMPSARTLADCLQFIDFAADFYDREDDRERALKRLVETLVDFPGVKWQQLNEEKTAKPDACWYAEGPLGFIILEWKNEHGLGGDPWLQGVISYEKMVAQSKCADYFKRSNLPAILISIVATRLEISAAIFTDGVYVDKLLSIDLRLGFHPSKHVWRLAQAFEAVKTSGQQLQEYYKALVVSTPSVSEINISHTLPAPTPDPLPQPGQRSDMPDITFLCKMSRSTGAPLSVLDRENRRHGLYLATMRVKDSKVGAGATITKEVVVKFTGRYNERAHRLLASRSLAPELHACVPVIGDVYMVVMDLVDAKSLHFVPQPYPYAVYENVREAVDILHENDLVFGDLRWPNMLYLADEKRTMLIDFDWVGNHGKDRYSAALNVGISWPAGVDRGAIMYKEHDLSKLEELKRLCEEVE